MINIRWKLVLIIVMLDFFHLFVKLDGRIYPTIKYVKSVSSGQLFIFSRIFQRKISANRLALVGMAGGRAGRRRPQLG